MRRTFPLPKRLYIIRHARSLANQKLDEAEAAGADFFELPVPDHLSPIIELGERQVYDLASWMASLPESERPTKVLASTHLRTRQTAEGIVKHSGLLLPVIADERFIEKRWGVIGGMTRGGFARRFPQEAEARARKGEFLYRPPCGGESLRDVKKRVKPALEEHLAQSADENLVLVTHSQVIVVLRQLLEKLTERQALAIEGQIPNCSVCVYERKNGCLKLVHEYFVAPNRNV